MVTASYIERAQPRYQRLLGPIFVTAYLSYSIFLTREFFAGSRSRTLLLSAPLVFIIISTFPRATLLVLIPALLLDGYAVISSVSPRLPIAMVAVWGLGLTMRRWRFVPAFHWNIAILAGLLVVSLVLSERADTTLSASADLLTLLCGLGLSAVAASIGPSVRYVLAATGLTGTIASSALLTGSFGAIYHSADPIDGGGIDRVTAFGLNPNFLGLMLAISTVAFVALAVDFRFPPIAFLALPNLAALPALKSRSALLCIAAGILVLILVHRQTVFRLSVVAASSLLLIFSLSILPAAIPATYRIALGARANADLSQNDMARRSVAKLAVRAGINHPVFGVGYGNFTALANEEIDLPLNTHNDYLRLFAEAGLPALLCLSWIFISAIRLTMRIEHGRAARAVLITYGVALLLADTLSSLTVSAGIWVLLGAVVSAASRCSSASIATRRREPLRV